MKVSYPNIKKKKKQYINHDFKLSRETDLKWVKL